MSDSGRWAKSLVENYSESMSSSAISTLEELPPWVAALGAPVDDLRRLVELLARDLDAWARNHDQMEGEATRLEHELDQAQQRVRELEKELQEVPRG